MRPVAYVCFGSASHEKSYLTVLRTVVADWPPT
jgi:hypothetical protein